MVWNHRHFWFLHFVVTLTVLALALGWFWIPDSSALAVATSFAGAGVIIVTALVWIGVSFVYYKHPGVSSAVGTALRRLPALLAWGVISALLIWVMAPRVPWWVSWIVLPLILAPVGWSVSVHGLGGFSPGHWPLRFVRAYPLIAAGGVFVPFLLTQWHPALPGVALQTVSLAIRWSLAAALAATAWLFLCALLSTLEEGRSLTN
jgi:hypothetical protein